MSLVPFSTSPDTITSLSNLPRIGNPFATPIVTGTSGSNILYKYVLAPKSTTSFTKVEVDTGKSQDIDIRTLQESGLHLVLWLFKNKINPQDLLSIRDKLDNLPPSRMPTLDSELHTKVPAETLRAQLLEFMKVWYNATLTQRGVDPIGNVGLIRSDAFPVGWSPLHTVVADEKTSVMNAAVCTSASGTTLGPAACRASYQEVLRRIVELNAFLEACRTGDVSKTPTCLSTASGIATDIVQKANMNA